MIGHDQIDRLPGAAVYDPAGKKVGSVRQVFVDDESGVPAWVSVHTGIFGLNESFVPVHNARIEGDRLMVAVDRQSVKNAPRAAQRAEKGRELMDDSQVAELYQHYNVPYASRSGQERGDVQGRRAEPAAHRAEEPAQRQDQPGEEGQSEPGSQVRLRKHQNLSAEGQGRRLSRRRHRGKHRR